MAEYWVDLGVRGAKILQDDEGYCFSQDSVVLANLAKIKSGDRVLDLGSGCGAMLFLAKLKKGAGTCVGLELDPHACDMAARSAKGLDVDDMTFLNGDVRDVRGILKAESFDCVLCNPPYFKQDSPSSEVPAKRIARMESASLGDFASAAAYCLRFGGELWMTMKASRLSSLIYVLKEHSLEPKTLCLVYPKRSKGVDGVVVCARKGGKEGLKISELVVMDENGSYTPEFSELYK